MIRRRCGRVLAAAGDELVLFVAGAAERVAPVAGAACRAGDLIALSTEAGRPATVEVLWRHPTGEFPAPRSDAHRLRDRWTTLRRRAELLDQTRAFFRQAGFLEIDTPLVVPSPGTETHLAPVPVSFTPAPGAARERRWLITSPEYHMKRLLAAGAPPLFQICKVLRDGERGAHHRPEFTMIEWYRPFAGYQALLEDCESWLLALTGGRTALSYQGRPYDLARPWPRLRVRDALRELGGVADPDALSPEQQLEVIVDRVEPQLGRERPVFLTHFPLALASLARPAPDDPGASERFELFLGGLELGNGFGELTDAAEQRRRCQADNAERRALGLPELPLDEDFLGALAEGMPPSAGIAVGLDRVVMLLADAATIDEVLAF